MTLLLLGGTAEARAIAEGLAHKGAPTLASLAGVVSAAPYPVAQRVGRFGGAEGFLDTLATRGITAVLDATHPFAERITHRSARLCRDVSTPYARFSRPAWRAGAGDKWSQVVSPEAAAAAVPEGARVFLATGAQEVARYTALSCRAQVFCRRAEPTSAPFPFAQGQWIVARGPFSREADRALFRDLAITCLITKNAGGEGARAKLDAARDLSLPVVMIDRPPLPEGVEILNNVEDALAWGLRRCN